MWKGPIEMKSRIIRFQFFYDLNKDQLFLLIFHSTDKELKSLCPQFVISFDFNPV